VLLIGLTLSHLISLGLYSIDRARLLQLLGGRALVIRVTEAVDRLDGIESRREARPLLRAMSDARVQLRLSAAPLVPDPETADAPARRPPMSGFLARALTEALDGKTDPETPRPLRVGLADRAALKAFLPGNRFRQSPPWMTGSPHMTAPRSAAGTDGEEASSPPTVPSEMDGAPAFGPHGGGGPWWRDRAAGAFPGRFHHWVIGDPEDEVLAVSVRLRGGPWLNVTAWVPRPRGFWTPGALASIALMVIVILALSLWAVRRLTRPLRAVAEAARRMGQDPRMAPLPETGSRELRAVAAAFNEMRERLARLVDNRTRLLAAISHDLRTPITTLRLRAEFVEDAEERARMLATLDDMEAMVRATLDFARDDVTAEAARPLDLRALVDAICDDLSETGRDVTVAETADAVPLAIRGRSSALRRAIINLVQNACAYAGAARVAVEAGPGTWAVVVRDDGPGIPEEHLAKVTDPFYRVETSRARETGGIGLGLSIVQAVADAHGARLILKNRPEGGLEARLEGPRDDDWRTGAADPTTSAFKSARRRPPKAPATPRRSG